MKFEERFALRGVIRLLVAVVGLSLLPSHAQALVLYNESFEEMTVGQFSTPGPGLFYTLANMGGNALVWEHTATGGVNGSQGLNVLFDGTGRPFYLIALTDFEPTASDAAPLGNDTVSSASQIRFSFDTKVTGSLSGTPITIVVTQTDPNYEADRGIDANQDGDMTDNALIFQSRFKPAIVTTGDYSHVSFTLDQGELSAGITRVPSFPPGGPPVTIPLTPQFDPTVSLSWGISFGSTDFGSDAGNVVSLDNIQIETVPEPSTFSILAAAMCAICLLGARAR